MDMNWRIKSSIPPQFEEYDSEECSMQSPEFPSGTEPLFPNLPYIGFFPFPVLLFHSLEGASWDHLWNKLLALPFLFWRNPT